MCKCFILYGRDKPCMQIVHQSHEMGYTCSQNRTFRSRTNGEWVLKMHLVWDVIWSRISPGYTPQGLHRGLHGRIARHQRKDPSSHKAFFRFPIRVNVQHRTWFYSECLGTQITHWSRGSTKQLRNRLVFWKAQIPGKSWSLCTHQLCSAVAP